MNFFRKMSLFRHKLPQVLGIILIIFGITHILIGMANFIFHSDINSLMPFTRLTYYVDGMSAKNVSDIISLFFGFVELVIGRGMFLRMRRSLIFAIIIVVVMAVNDYIFFHSEYVVYSGIVYLVILVISYKEFSEKSQDTIGIQQVIAWITVVLAIAYGVTGSYLLREQFKSLKTITDAFYYTLVTYSTVGYGDIYPLTQQAKIFTVTMILIGIGAFITTFTFVITPLLENRMKGVLNMMEKIAHIHNHVIICGYSKLSLKLINSYLASNTPIVIIEENKERFVSLDESVQVVVGSISSKKTFAQARLQYARSIIFAFEDDSMNILSAITGKELLDETRNTHTQLISRIENEENIEKIKKLGVKEVVCPSAMAAASILAIGSENVI